jgi:hypothetical protein
VESMDNFENKKAELKLIRDKFLKFHKILMDWERSVYEREFGSLTAGKFLEMLLSDEHFAWLRIISTLIVRIDEAFDVDDGLSNEMVEGFYQEIGDMFDENSVEYKTFKEKLRIARPLLPEADRLGDEIKKMLA